MDKEYLLNRVVSANDTQLVVILYEGLMECLQECIENIDNVDSLSDSIGRGRDILAELLATLKGNSEIVKNLRSIYLFINTLITEGQNRRTVENFKDAIKIITPILEGWSEIAENNEMTQNSPAVVAGLTYGKSQLNTYVSELKDWKKG